MSRYFGTWKSVCGYETENEAWLPPRNCPNCSVDRWFTPEEYESEGIKDEWREYLADQAANWKIRERKGD